MIFVYLKKHEDTKRSVRNCSKNAIYPIEHLEVLFDEKESIRSKIIELEKQDDTLGLLDELVSMDEKYDEVVDKISNICASKNNKWLMII